MAPPVGGATAPGSVGPGAGGQQGAPAQAAPAQQSAQAAPAPAGAVAPNTSQTTDAAATDPLGGLLNPDTLTAMAPTAMMAGAMMLPMIASALAGLGGGGSGSGSGGSGESGSSGGLSPEAQKAIDVLKQMKDVYGNSDTEDSENPTSGKQLGTTTSSGTGSGSTATKLKAHQLYQRNAATAFNNLDNDLVNYMRSMAGNHKVDKKAVIALLREVDTQLAEIGSAAYTKAGQQKVHQILTNALAKAAKIVSGGNATATGTASEINRLTNQYIYNLAG
ncbi:DUF4226 domain-containing protein, partial [Nocardia vinacea]|uniref:DUF4226 domain-containing protein n=1 Tax=Nocardia vinacea TaxID=96468 RepID=UPI0012F65346